jgi:hypothetical protein
MRLWTLHPKCLDARGLVVPWREALLAQKVLRGETRGYKLALPRFGGAVLRFGGSEFKTDSPMNFHAADFLRIARRGIFS